MGEDRQSAQVSRCVKLRNWRELRLRTGGVGNVCLFSTERLIMSRFVRSFFCLSGGGLGLLLGCLLDVDQTCNEVQCGENAYCSEGVCTCVGGYDGAAELGCDPIQQWSLVDACDDGLDVQWRLFAQARDWAWPGDGTVFETVGLNQNMYEEIVCLEGEIVCLGAAVGGSVWGKGLDGSLDCHDCCYPCDLGLDGVDFGLLACES
ncbi:MAG: hypothetical protein V3V08_00490 [Nannocystaceae bacterium]